MYKLRRAPEGQRESNPPTESPQDKPNIVQAQAAAQVNTPPVADASGRKAFPAKKTRLTIAVNAKCTMRNKVIVPGRLLRIGSDTGIPVGVEVTSHYRPCGRIVGGRI
jgi:hypothetical protein